MKKEKLSKCCKAKMRIHGDAECLSFVCNHCGNECSFEIQNHWVIDLSKKRKTKSTKLGEWNKLTWD